MKIACVLVLLLAITLTSEAQRFQKKVLKKLEKLEELEKKLDALSQLKGVNDPYVKLNSAPVCFGAKDSQFGSFKASVGGNLMKVKLVHLYGYVTCLDGRDNYWSHWGCGNYLINGNSNYIDVSLTTATDNILLPPSEIGRSDKWTLIPGYSSRSPELVMSIYDTPVAVTAGQELRLWYTQDLINGPESDNAGRVCADVFGYFM